MHFHGQMDIWHFFLLVLFLLLLHISKNLIVGNSLLLVYVRQQQCCVGSKALFCFCLCFFPCFFFSRSHIKPSLIESLPHFGISWGPLFRLRSICSICNPRS